MNILLEPWWTIFTGNEVGGYPDESWVTINTEMSTFLMYSLEEGY